MQTLNKYPTALTIAGSDSGGCAGIQADLKTFSSLGVFGASVITSITVQNTREVRAVQVLPSGLIRQQAEAVLDDIRVDALKTGMLPSPEIVADLALLIDRYGITNTVVDPVMVATSGARLCPVPIAASFRELLYRRVSLITPNIPEAEVLSGIAISSEKDVFRAGDILLNQGCRAVLIKGGHLTGPHAVDTLFRESKEPVRFSSPLIDSRNLHGTGCTLSSAIAAYLALGKDLLSAVGLAKDYITAAITAGKGVATGQGFGPVNHFHDPQVLIPIEYESKSQ